jgi:hypothetical protein
MTQFWIGFIAGCGSTWALWIGIAAIIMWHAYRTAPEGPDCEWHR